MMARMPGGSYPLEALDGDDLRRLYAAPEQVGAALDAGPVARVLGLARLVLDSREACLWCVGRSAPVGGAPLGDVPDPLPTGPEVRPCGEEGLPALLLPLRVPVRADGDGPSRVFGVLAAAPGPGWQELAPELTRQVEAVLLGAALGSGRTTDVLTGLLTRDAFRRRLRAFEPRVAAGEPAAAVVLDVDDLSGVNAREGHARGDALLRTVASLLEGAAPDAVAARWGGDELALFLPRAAAADANAAALALTESIAAATEGATACAGVACSPQHGHSVRELLERADRALAAAKESGPGQLVTWTERLLEARRRARRVEQAGLLTGDASVDFQHVQALLETVKAVSRLAPLEDILTEVLDRCVLFTGAERGLVLLRDAATGRWTVHLARKRGGQPLPAGETGFAASIAEQAHASGRAIHKLAPDPISPSAEALGLQAVLCTPLRGEDIPEGAVYVDAHSSVARFDAPLLAFFEALTAEVGTALRNAVLYERLLARARSLEEDVAGREEELARVRALWARDREVLRGGAGEYEQLVGASPAMARLFALLSSVEHSLVPVLIQGESGTGKELVARAIHARSPRGAGPFVAESCAAISEDLFERELFGHVKGAFTGAHADRPGLLEAADAGTLFLDEVGELPLGAQAKLLRCLQEGEVRRIGETKVRPVDVRVVVATNRALQAMVQDGSFREDLYYRLAVFRIELPPLRERSTDVPLLVEHLLGDLGERGAIRTTGITPAAVGELTRRRWPGNVRQLRNVLERAAVVAGAGPIEVEHLEPGEGADADPATGGDLSGLFELPLNEAKATFLALYTQRLIDEEGSIAAAARRAGASRQTLYRLLEREKDG